MTLQADFASQDYFRNPAAAIEKLPYRRLGRRSAVPDHRQGVGHDDAGACGPGTEGRRHLHHSQGRRHRCRTSVWWMPGIVRTLANSMLSMDEPDHKRLRDIVDEAFRRRAVLEMEPHIQATGDALADELFAEGSPADLVERYARKLPLSVITELLGLPLADRPKFIAWAGSFTRFTGALGFLAMIPNILAIKRYMEWHLETVRKEGGKGLIAEIVAGREGRGTNQPE